MRSLLFQSICDWMRSGPDFGVKRTALTPMRWIVRSARDVIMAAKPQNRNIERRSARSTYWRSTSSANWEKK